MSEQKTLVVYFSHPGEAYNVGVVEAGNTELLAKEIIAKTGADEFKIESVKKYPVSYAETVEIATEERDEDMRPEYVGDIDMTGYDTIFLGYPIWWGDLPMIVYSFIEKHDFSGKTVVPFNTHEGSGNAGTYSNLKSIMSGAILKGDGFNMTGILARKDEGMQKIDQFLEELGY